MKAINFKKFNSVVELTTYYNTEKKCKDAIMESRWDEDVVCPKCGKHNCKMGKDGRYYCTNSKCKHRFSVLVGTIYENTKVSLRKWFLALYFISSQKKSISTCQLAKNINVTQCTAWYMKAKIMTLFAQDEMSDTTMLKGKVEMDEMYLGGKETNKHVSKKVQGTQGRSTKTKAPIFGMIERGGQAKVWAVKDTTASTLEGIVRAYVAINTTVFTDELAAYNNLNNDYDHQTINHKKKEYSVGDVTTNTIEGFWGEFKRVIFGTHHHVSREHLQAYIDEQTYRYNTRKAKPSLRFSMMFKSALRIVRYDDVKLCEAKMAA